MSSALNRQITVKPLGYKRPRSDDVEAVEIQRGLSAPYP